MRDLTTDRVAGWSQTNEQTLAPTTALIAVLTVKQILPVRHPSRPARPQPRQPTRTSGETRLETQACRDPRARRTGEAARLRLPQPIRNELLAYTGLRIGEALGLTWADIDHPNAVIHVHRQLGRDRTHTDSKTPAARRDVILAPPIANLLRQRWLATVHKNPDDLVFATGDGRPLDYRNVGADFRTSVKKAGLASASGRVSLHSLRHSFASLLIADGQDVVFVSGQLGHAKATTTLNTYAHLYARADHADSAKQALARNHAAMASTGP